MSISTGPQSDQISGIISRAKAIILTPKSEWLAIDAEPASVTSIYKGYVIWLAAIPPLALFIGGVVFGYGAFGIKIHPPFFSSLVHAVVHYLLTLAGVFILSLIVDWLAPTFQGQKNPIQALKLVAYASTASWLAGIFGLIPALGILSIVGLYSLYLFYTGLPVLMKSPADKALPYTAVVIVAAIVVYVIIGTVAFALVGANAVVGSLDGSTITGSLSLPGGGEVKLDKLEQAAKALSDTAKQAESGEHPAGVPADTLKAMLPGSVAGLDRKTTESVGGNVAGLGGTNVSGTYRSGSKEVELSVTDLGAMGAFAAAGGVLGVSGDKETDTTYSKLYQADGKTMAEDYDKQSHSGSFAVVVANRFAVTAKGDGLSMAELKQAVSAVDLSKLEALAK